MDHLHHADVDVGAHVLRRDHLQPEVALHLAQLSGDRLDAALRLEPRATRSSLHMPKQSVEQSTCCRRAVSTGGAASFSWKIKHDSSATASSAERSVGDRPRTGTRVAQHEKRNTQRTGEHVLEDQLRYNERVARVDLPNTHTHRNHTATKDDRRAVTSQATRPLSCTVRSAST